VNARGARQGEAARGRCASGAREIEGEAAEQGSREASDARAGALGRARLGELKGGSLGRKKLCLAR
jgi:hypothetical protein